jgi:hypothetical protein
MKTIFLIVILFIPVLVDSGTEDDLKTEGAVSSLEITVLSNIGKQFFQYNLGQSCFSLSESGNSAYAHSFPVLLCITIPVKEFKCENRFAYNDLMKLLKAEEYPILEIDIPGDANIINAATDSVLLKDVSLTVAGASSRYDISCKIDKDWNGYQTLKGRARIKLTDLGIDPPVRLFGLLRVSNEVTIDFGFCLKS